MNPLLKQIEDGVKDEFKNPDVIWSPGYITLDEKEFLEEECKKESAFDEYHVREIFYERYKKGLYPCIVRECEYGKVIAFLDSAAQDKEIPWALWGRILRIFQNGHSTQHKIFFFANRMPRKLPSKGEKITPKNINGGYTYSCTTKGIFIYRAEDATRVLIHELFHASCTDNFNESIDIVESKTEAWAELMYCGLLSRGKRYIFKDLIQRQSQYMSKQNKEVAKYIDVSTREFPWRYTIGKEEVWKKWGIFDERIQPPDNYVKKSLRLTIHPPVSFKILMGVSAESSIL